MQRHQTKHVEKRVVVQTECDACGRVENEEDPKRWLRFSSHHNDWGNDSVESWDYFDVCSFSCYLTVVRREFENYDRGFGEPTLEIDGKDWWFLQDMLVLSKQPTEA